MFLLLKKGQPSKAHFLCQHKYVLKMDLITKFYNTRTLYRFNAHPDSLHAKVINLIKPPKTILDVGCSDGYIGRILKYKNNVVYGIEVSPEIGKKAKKYLD